MRAVMSVAAMALGPARAAALRSVRQLATRKHETTVHRLEFADDEVVIAKRCRSERAAVEAAVYEEVLPRLSAASVRYYGKADEAASGFSWILVGEARGAAYVADNADHRAAAARWLAVLHTEGSALDVGHILPDRGVGYFRDCARTACAAIAAGLSNAALAPADRAVLKAVLATAGILDGHWADFERFLARVPATVVHNDFSVDNLRVQRRDGRLVVVPFDWEDACRGTPAVDLAQMLDHPAYAVRPDLTVYALEIRNVWPHLNGADLRAVGEVGSLFRIVAELRWEAWRLSYEYQSARELAWLADYITIGRDLIRRVDGLCLTPGWV